MSNRIARQDFTLPKYGDLQDKINDFIICAKLHHTIDESKEDAENLAKARSHHMKPTWDNVVAFLTEILDTLNQDRIDPVKRRY